MQDVICYMLDVICYVKECYGQDQGWVSRSYGSSIKNKNKTNTVATSLYIQTYVMLIYKAQVLIFVDIPNSGNSTSTKGLPIHLVMHFIECRSG